MKLILLFILSFNLIASDKILDISIQMDKEEPQILLDSISQHAIRIGSGDLKKYYIFVDPMCPYSKNFIKLISQNKMQQIHTSYYVFLYRLPKFKSDKLIQYIYQCSDNKSALLDVMVKEKNTDLRQLQIDNNKVKIIDEISFIARKMNIKKRPYMIVFKEGSKYCDVSEGSAPCLEEFDF